MGIHILTGRLDGTRDAAVLIDSVTGTAFGPLFTDEDEAEGFLGWLKSTYGKDARILGETRLHELVDLWRAIQETQVAHTAMPEARR